MARLHRRNFGLPTRAQPHARWSVLENLARGIATLLSRFLLICLGLAALCWRLLHRTLALVIGRFPARRFLLAARERLFRNRRQRWYRVQALRDGRTRYFDR